MTPTQKLARKWACCVSTIERWKASGAPLDAPGWRDMSRWLAQRDHVGKGTQRALRALKQADPAWQAERQASLAAVAAQHSAQRAKLAVQPLLTPAQEAAKIMARYRRKARPEAEQGWAEYFAKHRASFATEQAWQDWCRQELDACAPFSSRPLKLTAGLWQRTLSTLAGRSGG